MEKQVITSSQASIHKTNYYKPIKHTFPTSSNGTTKAGTAETNPMSKYSSSVNFYQVPSLLKLIIKT